MKRKLLLALLIICSLCFAFAFTACGDNGKHKLTFYYNDDDLQSYAVYGNGIKDKEIVVPSAYEELPVTEICGFANCSKLTKITIPDSVTKIGNYAFYNCTKLTNITIPNSVTKIGEGAFSGCTALNSITITDGVTEIGNGAFSDCTALTSIEIPDSVTKIGYYAFSGCTALTSVTLPAGIAKLKHYEFGDCTSLKNIIFRGTKEQWNSLSANMYWDMNTGEYTVTCTDGTVTK